MTEGMTHKIVTHGCGVYLARRFSTDLDKWPDMGSDFGNGWMVVPADDLIDNKYPKLAFADFSCCPYVTIEHDNVIEIRNGSQAA